MYTPEPNFPAGSDSAEITRSNINATACLKVAAAVLKQFAKYEDPNETRLETNSQLNALKFHPLNSLSHTIRGSIVFKKAKNDTKSLSGVFLKVKEKLMHIHFEKEDQPQFSQNNISHLKRKLGTVDGIKIRVFLKLASLISLPTFLVLHVITYSLAIT